MTQVKNFNDLTEMIENEKVIKIDATNMLMELDVLPSVTTQAALNKWLVSLGKRLKNESDIVIEALGSNPITYDEYDKWLSENFTNYSYNLFKKTISL